jgi:flavin reductase (DIM6/NTAB) family NADH-FMN oxidoreductase RutF
MKEQRFAIVLDSNVRPIVIRRDKKMKEDIAELAQSFRGAMRRHASSVGIIATEFEGGLYGMAATSITSLSVDPPSVLFCVNKSASTHQPLLQSRRFSISVLSEGQHDVCADFSGRLGQAERFRNANWRETEGGLPYLASAQAVFMCEVFKTVDFESHSVIMALCNEVTFMSNVAPLLYVDGKCRTLGALLG